MSDINNSSLTKNRLFSAKFWKSVFGQEPHQEKEQLLVTSKAEEKIIDQETRTENERTLIRSELNLEKNAVFTVSTYSGKSREIELPPERGSNGEVIKRTIIVGKTGKGIETGILTTSHFKIYLVLIEFWEKAGRPIYDPVHFTTYKIIKRLDLQDDGRTYSRVKQSLYDLRQIPIEFIHSFFSPQEGHFNTLEPFTILNHLRVYEKKKIGEGQKTRGYGEFQFDRYILESLVSNYVHPLRLDVIKSFKAHKDIAVLLYTYIDRNLAFKNKFEINLELLFDNLDLSQSYVRYPAERKRVIGPVLKQIRGKELSTGILSSAQIDKTKDGKGYKLVCHKKSFLKQLKEQEEASHQPEPTLWNNVEISEKEAEKPESTEQNSELLPLLIEKGLTQKQASKLVEEKSPDIINDQLTYLPFRLREYKAQGKEINEAAILYESINDNWSIPKGYLGAEKEKEREVSRIERERLANLEQEEHDKAAQEKAEIEAYKETLDPDERAKLRERALKQIRSMEGINEQFIGEPLIVGKENEILKSEMG